MCEMLGGISHCLRIGQSKVTSDILGKVKYLYRDQLAELTLAQYQQQPDTTATIYLF